MGDLALAWGWQDRKTLIEMMAGEISFPPYFFTLGEIGRHAKIDIPKRDRLITALQAQGHRAVMTHLEAQAVKTTATFAACIAIAQTLARHKKSA
jgi:tRNA (guanine26-N2/guanine27-N2)-dimethyltransferase